MNIRNIAKKKITGYLFCGMMAGLLVFTGFTYMRANYLQKQIAEKVLRFHVLANSDSEEDQNLKLKVRDAVGSYMQQLFAQTGAGERGLAACEEVVYEHLDEIKQTAEKVITEEGYHYEVSAAVERTEFPVKTYGDYTFPAGEYEALRLTIGEAEGHNWWCVMYPNMCFVDGMYEVVDENAEESLREVLSEEEYEAVLSSGNYEVEFKYLGFLNELVNRD